MKTNIERIKEFLQNKGLSIRKFEQSIGASNGAIGRAMSKKSDINSAWLSKIIETYPEINPEWLLSGVGNMLKNEYCLSHENENSILENNQNMNTDFEPLMNGTTKKEKNTENKNERKVLISSNIPPVSRAGYNNENIDWEEFYRKQDIINKFLVIYKHKNISFDYEDISGDFSLCWSYMLHYSINQQLDHIAGKYLHGEIGIDAFSEAFKTTINKVSNFLQVIEPYRNQLKELQEKLHQFDIDNDRLFWFNEE